jgi:hypothetical protein
MVIRRHGGIPVVKENSIYIIINEPEISGVRITDILINKLSLPH